MLENKIITEKKNVWKRLSTTGGGYVSTLGGEQTVTYTQRFRRLLIFAILSVCLMSGISAQTNLHTGTQNRVVVFVRFDGDPEMDTPRAGFESMFNGENNSLKSYFQSISNNKLTVHSLMYPANNGINSSFELKYCYYCYDNTWKGNYPNCRGDDITTLFDINIGFIIKELAGYLEASGTMPDASLLDADNDGNIDNFVIVFRGAARGTGRGVHSPQTGTISSTFTNTHGPIQLKGKTIKNYTITFERNSLETHCRFLLSYMGFPAQYRNVGTLPRSVGAWDPMDGPHLSYPLVYNRMRYTHNNWITDIPEITATGEYSLSSADNATNNAYKILSPDNQQYWVLEYRDNTALWETNIPEAGLIIYRVNTNYTGSVAANPEVYLYRKNGSPTVAGDINEAPFSNINGRSVFNAASNPFPFLSDGSTAGELDITDITFDGDKMSFRINRIYTNIQPIETGEWDVTVTPGSNKLQLFGEGIESVSIYDLYGRLLFTGIADNRNTIELPERASGVYIARLVGQSTEKTCKFIIK